MTALSLTLPMPPTVNHLFANVRGRGRIATKHYTQWRIEAGLRLNTQRPSSINGPVELEYEYGTDTRADLGNLEKALTDLLVSSAIIDGDSKKTVKRISLWWGGRFYRRQSHSEESSIMFTTYRRLLADLAAIRNAKYSSDPERDAAVTEALYMTVFTMLEKLMAEENRQP